MTSQSLRKSIWTALLAGGLSTGIAFAAAPIAVADKIDDVFACTTAGSSMKDCCAKAGGDYWTTVKDGHFIEGCTIAESNTAVLRDPDGQLRIVDGDGQSNPLPRRSANAPLPPGATNVN